MPRSHALRLLAMPVAGFLWTASMTVPLAIAKEASSPPVIRLTPQLLSEYRARVLSQSYRQPVTQLQDAIEFPRVARDYCVSAQPRTKQAVMQLYDSWRGRNEVFLANAQEQVKRASERLAAEGVPLEEPGAGILRALRATQDSKKFCQAYPGLLERREQQFGAETGQLLEAVTDSEAEMSKLDRGQ